MRPDGALRVSFVTIVPSPYQRDLFAALARRPEVSIDVHYMEAESPDSPWPRVPLATYERVMPGFWLAFQNARWHFNWRLPDLTTADVVVLSSFTSMTGQWLLRRRDLRGRLVFWGERMRRQPPGWRRWAQATLAAPLANTAAIVSIGRAAEQDYAARFPEVAHHCLPYYCDLTRFLGTPRPDRSGEPFTFLFCGQMIARKGVDLLLRAFDRLVAAERDVHLLLVGREADLQSFLLGLSADARERVRYEGFQPPEKLHEYFSRCDVFILPSRHDGWGVVVNQALGAGLPVISSDAAGAGLDLVEDGVNGSLFAAGDLGGLERAMAALCDREKASRWGEASRRKALEITPEAGAARWVRIVQNLDRRP